MFYVFSFFMISCVNYVTLLLKSCCQLPSLSLITVHLDSTLPFTSWRSLIHFLARVIKYKNIKIVKPIN